jgi:type I restriction enzyme S subunit
MDVRPGYKQTEVGVIPEDWDCERIHDAAASSTNAIVGGPFGSDLVSADYVAEGVPVIRGQNMSGRFVSGDFVFVAPHKAKSLSANLARSGDLVFTQRGTLGQVAIVPSDRFESYLVSQSQMKVSLNRQRHDPAFVFHYFASRAGQQQIALSAIQTGVPHTNLGILRAYTFPAPALPEQRAIATALSDVDALLDGLDRLIAKKRDLKQATMQQLLTGQTRLPGFSGEWEVKRLGDHVTFLRNGVNSRAELLPEGRVRYLHYGDIHASTDAFLSPPTLPGLPDAKAARLDRLRDGDVIFADASEDIAGVCKSVELRGAGDTEVVSGLHTIAARFDKTVLADGFKGLLQHCPSFAAHLRRLAAGTKVYATNRAHIASVEMRLPSVAEQTAIAAVRSDMDAELAALEARRDKTRALKQGMMQELLTGKTRLVPTGGARA